MSRIDLGLEAGEAFKRSDELVRILRAGKLAVEQPIHGGTIDVLYATFNRWRDAERASREVLLDSKVLVDYLSRVKWPGPDFGERSELIRICSAAAWRHGRQLGDAEAVAEWFHRYREAVASEGGTDFENRQLSSDQNSEYETRISDLEAALTEVVILRDGLERCPSDVVARAENVCHTIENRQQASWMFDERAHFLGEFRLIAGIACRQVSRRKDARTWFTQAEAAFGETSTAVPDLLRVSYQRLALRAEEREIETVLEFAPGVSRSLRALGMREEALKCRFLVMCGLAEIGRNAEAVGIAREVVKEADELGNERLLGMAYANLANSSGLLGDSKTTFDAFTKGVPILRRLGDRIGPAKLRWAMGNLHRAQGRIAEAIGEFQACIEEFESIGMRADVAGLHLAVADLFLETGQEALAVQKIQAALPIIEELNLVSERRAAVSLLQDSLRGQNIDRGALREVHRYLESLKS